MSAAKVCWVAGLVAAIWVFWDWVFGHHTSLPRFCAYQFGSAFVCWAVDGLLAAYVRRRKLMQAEWDFYREVARQVAERDGTR